MKLEIGLSGNAKSSGRCDDLSDLGAIERDVVRRRSRDRAYPIARRARVLLRVEDDHRESVQIAATGRPRPVARLEAWRARDLRHNLVIEHFPSAVSITDGHAYDECIHLGLLSACCWSAEPNAP